MRLSCPLRRAAPERPRVRLRRLCCSLRELPRTTARVGEVADQAVHAVGVAACEREDAAGDVAKLNEADRACVAEPAPRSAAARSATARLVAKVAVALAGGRLSLRFVQSQEVSVTSWMAICQSDALTVCGLS